MKVYDFDNTIYRGDSTAHFYFYCLSRRPKMLIHLPATALAGLRYRFGAISKTQFKQTLYRFLTCLGNTEEMVENFWKGHKKNLKQWYLDSKEPTADFFEFLKAEVRYNSLYKKYDADVVDGLFQRCYQDSRDRYASYVKKANEA